MCPLKAQSADLLTGNRTRIVNTEETSIDESAIVGIRNQD